MPLRNAIAAGTRTNLSNKPFVPGFLALERHGEVVFELLFIGNESNLHVSDLILRRRPFIRQNTSKLRVSPQLNLLWKMDFIDEHQLLIRLSIQFHIFYQSAHPIV
jgi:hypothetical protein